MSGSGKSSLVFDTICTEAQRQLVGTYSTYARRRLPQLTRSPVDAVRNISPCIVIDQKRLGASSRSTVGTVTEIYTYLRMLFSRCGRPFVGWSHPSRSIIPMACVPPARASASASRATSTSCSTSTGASRKAPSAIPPRTLGSGTGGKSSRPRSSRTGSRYAGSRRPSGSACCGRTACGSRRPTRGATYEGTFEGVARKLERLHVDKDEDQIPRTGKEAYRRLFTERACPDCGGVRLNAAARAVELAGGWTIGRLVGCELTELDRVLEDLVAQDDYEPIRDVVATLVARMRGTLRHLIDIGVGYLSLTRSVPTLSGGESQRVKMARQLDCDLVDLIYILDEPTVGLHPRHIDHRIAMLHRLRDHGNSVLVVEHDPAVIRAADWIVDMGPRTGDGGGEVVFSVRLDDLLRADTMTSRALNDRVASPSRGRRTFDDVFRIENGTSNNLRNLTVRIPKGVLACVTGVAGSGRAR